MVPIDPWWAKLAVHRGCVLSRINNLRMTWPLVNRNLTFDGVDHDHGDDNRDGGDETDG